MSDLQTAARLPVMRSQSDSDALPGKPTINSFLRAARAGRSAILSAWHEVDPAGSLRALIELARQGETQAIDTFRDARIDLNQADADHVSPMSAAAAAGQIAAMKHLREAGASAAGPSTPDSIGPLAAAAATGQIAAMKFLLNAKARPRGDDFYGRSRVPLIEAVRNGHVEATQFLLNHRLGIVHKDLGAALAVAAEQSNLELITLLGQHVKDTPFKSGPAVLKASAPDSPPQVLQALVEGNPAKFALPVLKAAVESGNLEAVKHWLPKVPKSQVDRLPELLHLALSSGEAEVVNHLSKHVSGFDINKFWGVDGRELNSLMASALNGHLNVVQALLGRQRLDIDAQAPKGETALLLAAMMNHTRIVKRLLSTGADPLIATHNGDTPLSEAEFNHHEETATLLRTAIAKRLRTAVASNDESAARHMMSAPDLVIRADEDHGENHLLVATIAGQIDEVERLLSGGANPQIANRVGQSALSEARRHEDRDALLEVIERHTAGVTSRARSTSNTTDTDSSASTPPA